MRSFIPSALLGVVLTCGVTGSAVFAQDQAQPAAQTTPAQAHKAPDPQRQTKRMAKKLGLTPDQQAKIEPILADRDQQVQSLRANTALAPSDCNSARGAVLHTFRKPTGIFFGRNSQS